jgi:hypothetical protein
MLDGAEAKINHLYVLNLCLNMIGTQILMLTFVITFLHFCACQSTFFLSKMVPDSGMLKCLSNQRPEFNDLFAAGLYQRQKVCPPTIHSKAKAFGGRNNSGKVKLTNVVEHRLRKTSLS